MFCPSCGAEDRQSTQFCRACGTDLRVVRTSLERPDAISASAASAREEIGRAIAEKIREMEGSRDLKRVAEDVLPQIEKFLESPGERRLRLRQAGVITAATGLGVGLGALLLSSALFNHELIQLTVLFVAFGIITFLVGLGLMVTNDRRFGGQRGEASDRSEAQRQGLLDEKLPPQLRAGEVERTPTTSNLMNAAPSVTEHTTHHLKSQ